ncbi:MAG: archease [Rhodospirillales bacterium]|nr:MAG: archease [Rhodospirillales bacterium]
MSAQANGWSHFAHEADIGLAASGPSLGDVFERVATAMTGAITDPELVRTNEKVTVHCEAPDIELLLVEWLNALVFEMATRGMLFGRFEVRIDGCRLVGTAWGEKISRERHHPAVEVKGATYTGLSVHRRGGSWVARCVVDV